MSTRAQIAIQTGARLVAHEICQVRANELDCFDPSQILPRPPCELSHLYYRPALISTHEPIGASRWI